MPDHPEKPPLKPRSTGAAGKPRRSRFRRFLRAVLLLLLLCAVFYQPIVTTILRIVLVKIAARDHITLKVHFSGNLLTNLTVSDIEAHPDGLEPTPVEKISIRQVHLEYSIPRLVKQGIGGFLGSFEIDDADLIFAPQPSKTKAETEAKRTIAEDLNNILGQPALYADLVKIQNFNLIVRSGDATTEVKGVNILFHPWDAGYLRIAKLQVPGLPVWKNLSAETSYAQRNLFIKDFTIAPELIIDELNFDASQRAQNKGSAMLKGRFFGGTAQVGIVGSQLNKKGKNLAKGYDTTLKLDAAGIDVHAAAAYFNAEKVPPMRLAWLTTTFTGEPESPQTWKGDLAVRVESAALGKLNIDAVELDTLFSAGKVSISSGHVQIGHTDLELAGAATLPESINNFARTDGNASFQLDAPDLLESTAIFLPSQPIAGAIKAGGKVTLQNGKANLNVSIKASRLTGTPFDVESATIQLDAARAIDATGASPLEGLTSHLVTEVTGIRYATFNADKAQIDLESAGNDITLHRAEVGRAENQVEAHGSYKFPPNGTDFLTTPLDAQFTIKAPTLETFGLKLKDNVLSGHLDASGKVAGTGSAPEGSIQMNGGDFVFGKFKAQTLAAKINVKGKEALIDELRFQIDGKNMIGLTGKSGVASPNSYEGALLVVFNDLAVLHPLLETFGVSNVLGGSLDLSVESSGTLTPPSHTGQLKLAVDKAHFGAIDLREIRLAGLFGPTFAETSELKVVSGPTKFEGGLEWKDNRLKLHDIDLHQGAIQVLSGYVSIPFEPFNATGPIPFEKRLAANVNANQLDIEKLLAAFKQTAPVAGTVTANLVAGGTLVDPAANLKIVAKGLKAKAAAQFDAAELDVTAHYSEKELTLDLAARQRDIQPLTVKGRVPLDLHTLVEQKKLDPNLPLDVTVKLPPTSLAFVPKIAAAVRSIAGTAAIDGRISGTVGNPQFSGSAAVKVDYARLKSEGVPPIGASQINLGFTQNSITVQKVHGDIGGGTFDLGGKVQFAKITEPVFDLHLRSNSILVKRDDSVTVRVDTDLAATGPLAAAKVAGTVWVTQSRFFREIDILPIALPGRPKPQPRSAPSAASFSLGPPLSNWTFDIAIKTRPNDSFQIRGNLANGSAALDLKFGGTGLQPWLEGSVNIENFVASLPFSKLSISRGFVTFARDDAFMPKLDISADSNLRDYHINAYIYGSARDPQLSLTSEPPLPQQDILSLLATGATASELTGSSDVLASRAAVLLFQQLYHKIFKTRDPSENMPLHDRLSVEVGSVDSQTGREQVAATFKVGGNFYLVGDVDVTGAFTGRVRYLVRFR